MKKLKAAVIGLGIGEQHLITYLKHPGCEIEAICDLDLKKLKSVSQKYNIKSTTQVAEKILKDETIDLVSICSYDNHHFKQIELALEHNKHVFVEKPFVLFAEEAFKIRQLLKEKPHLKLSSNLILRKSPRFLDLKERILRGELGEIYHIDCSYNYGRLEKLIKGWRGQLDFFSIIYGGGVHLIDLALWLTQSRIETVQAQGSSIASRNSCFRNFDMVASVVKFENGCTANINSNFASVCPHFHKFDVYGTKASFSNDYHEARLYHSRNPNDTYEQLKTPYPGVHKGDLLKDFMDSILSQSNSNISTNEVFNAMSVCFAMEKAVQSGNLIKVEYI